MGSRWCYFSSCSDTGTGCCHGHYMVAVLAALLLLGSGASAMNVATLDGVVVIADSQSRNRWGLDGYQPHLAIDGNSDSSGAGTRTTSWASDNWEVTHSLALIFPRQVAATEVRIHWAVSRGKPCTPREFTVRGWHDGDWVELAAVKRDAAEAMTSVQFEPARLAALEVVQLPEGAAPSAGRRLWIAELEVEGKPAEPAVATEMGPLHESIGKRLCELREREDAARVTPLLEIAMQRRKTRGFEAIVDREDLERGRRNIATRPWARSYADRVIKDADWWVAQSDEYIYGLLPEGNPRALCPSFEKGCPLHGGARSTFRATLEKPYIWRCSKGGEEWYDGAVVKNPTTGEEVIVKDDGSGWLAPAGFPEAGRRYFFVAAYRYYLLGKLFSGPYEPDGGSEYRGGTPIVQLSLAYAFTGDAKYAHKAAVMLSRLAELYRTYDGCVESPSQRQDGYIGQTFERFLVQNLILACDLIWDEIEGDEDLRDLFAARGDADYDGDGRVTGGDLTYNIQRNLLGYIYEYLHRLMPYMDGDFLMYEMTALAALGHCLENPEIAGEALESDLGLRVLLTNSWFRDGKFIYDSTGYNRGNAQTPLMIAEWLHGLRTPPRYPEPLDVYHHPHYRVAMLYNFLRHLDCDGRVPQIGDCGGSRSVSLRATPPFEGHDEKALLRLPESRDVYLARLLAASGGDPEAYRMSHTDWWLVFHAEEPPRSDVELPPDVARSHLFEDGGIAILRAGANAATRVHVPFTFSKGSYGHGHTDKLAINIFRYGYDWSADIGYPTTWTDRKLSNWETDTASHCTVMLDEKEQRGNIIGQFHWYATTPLVDACEASAPAAYPDAELYRRTVALVRDDDGEPLYVVDVFRTAGAKVRDYLFHSLGKPDELTVALDDADATWSHQPEGSLAGEDVEPTSGRGYSWLHDLYRANTADGLTATWRPSGASSQPDRYLLTREEFDDVTVEFTMTKTGKASGDRERAVFVFHTHAGSVGSRKVIMMPVDLLEVGKAAKVRVEIAGDKAQMTLDGKPVGHVDVAGDAPERGSVGFLHYYNYGWEYRDLVITPKDGEPIGVSFDERLNSEMWARIDPTYQAADGVLNVADARPRAIRLYMLGAPGRELIRAKAEGHGIRGQSPFEGHLIVRQRTDDAAQGSIFASVIEVFRTEARVLKVERVQLDSEAAGALTGADAVALRVTTVALDGTRREDIVISALRDEVVRSGTVGGTNLTFQGRFGLVATRDGEAPAMSLVGGGQLTFGDSRLDGKGSVLGTVKGVEPAEDAVLIELRGGSPKPSEDLVGRPVRITNPQYACPAVFTITGVEQVGADIWRLRLNMTLTLAHGNIGDVDAAKGSFTSSTPVMKLRVNPGLFNGKCVRSSPEAAQHRLTTATEGELKLADPKALADFSPDGTYTVYDVGVGDEVEIVGVCTSAAR